MAPCCAEGERLEDAEAVACSAASRAADDAATAAVVLRAHRATHGGDGS